MSWYFVPVLKGQTRQRINGSGQSLSHVKRTTEVQHAGDVTPQQQQSVTVRVVGEKFEESIERRVLPLLTQNLEASALAMNASVATAEAIRSLGEKWEQRVGPLLEMAEANCLIASATAKGIQGNVDRLDDVTALLDTVAQQLQNKVVKTVTRDEFGRIIRVEQEPIR